MVKRVCLIVNYNLYESKRHFTQKLVEAMDRHGIETKIIDVQEGVLGVGVINSIREFNPDFTCSFNSLMPMKEQTFLWDLLRIPHLSFLVDPALYSVNLTSSPYSILSCVDRNDIEALHTYRFPDAFFWPHAVERELEPSLSSDDKEFDVVFLGSCYDYESLQAHWRTELPKAHAEALDHATDIIFNDNSVSLTQALITAWNASGVDFTGVDFLSLFFFLDYYTRGRDRVELVRSIKDKHIHIFGELFRDTPGAILGWPQLLKSQNNLTFHPPVRYDHSYEILRKSKVCLNSMPFFRNGTHERVFMGLALGSLPITSESAFLRESFTHRESLLYYDSNQLDLVNDLVNEYVDDESKRNAVIEKGSAIVMRDHTWDVRVEQLNVVLPDILKEKL